MIVDLPDTTANAVSRRLVSIREDGGAVALGRVLTLVIAATSDGVEQAVAVANDASREHPMRVIVVAAAEDDGHHAARLDAQIRVGGDAGASEVVILHAHGEAASDRESLVTALLLPDAPVVVWWSHDMPELVATSDLGRIAARRITDASTRADPAAALRALAEGYCPGDTDLSWTRLTLWRAQLAAVLDQPPYTAVERVDVAGASDSPSTLLLAAWLRLQLDAPVRCTFVDDPQLYGMRSVRLHRADGTIVLDRETPELATLQQPGQPDHEIALARRSLNDCLTEELRHLDPDLLYGRVLTSGLAALYAEGVLS